MKSRMDHVQVNGQWEAEDDQTFNDGICDASIAENRYAPTGISHSMYARISCGSSG